MDFSHGMNICNDRYFEETRINQFVQFGLDTTSKGYKVMKLMGKQEQGLVKTDLPHYYEVKIPNHPNGIPQMHCGMRKDVERLLEMYPDTNHGEKFICHIHHRQWMFLIFNSSGPGVTDATNPT